MQLVPDLDGRTAVVTGSAQRVGRELLLTLAAAGADVAVHYNTSTEAAEETAADAREYGVDATTVSADITDPAAVDAMFESIEATLGTVDILVNNVGNFDAATGRTSSGTPGVIPSRAPSTAPYSVPAARSMGCVRPAGAGSSTSGLRTVIDATLIR